MWKWFKELFTTKQGIMLAEMEERANWLRTMQKLDVKNGDIIVLRNARPLPMETVVNLKEAIKKIMEGYGFKVHVMILQEGTDICVLRKDAHEAFGSPKPEQTMEQFQERWFGKKETP
jgi:hypothetical protein